jgi:hypothetical protein
MEQSAFCAIPIVVRERNRRSVRIRQEILKATKLLVGQMENSVVIEQDLDKLSVELKLEDNSRRAWNPKGRCQNVSRPQLHRTCD